MIMQNLANIIQKNNTLINEECCRLFHGRGKKWSEFSHLSIDWYPPTILITTYKEISNEEKLFLVEIIKNIENLPYKNILLQKRYLKGESIEVLTGEIEENAFAVENSEKYKLNLNNPQNIGFFLDMKKGREWIRKNSQNKSVLNLFSYTCSLSVAALKGGALQVINVDMSKSSLSIGEHNHIINNVNGKAKFISYDIMNSFANLRRKGPFDLIIIDPPTNQGDSFKVERDYHKIVRKLNEMTNQNAQVMACLNSPFLTSQFLRDVFREYAPEFILQEKVLSSFSEMEFAPESGLKILVFKK